MTGLIYSDLLFITWSGFVFDIFTAPRIWRKSGFGPVLGATSIDKIGEVRLSDEIEEGGGLKLRKKAELYNY